MSYSTLTVLRTCALMLGIAFAAGPVLADKDKHSDKHSEKNGKYEKHDKRDKRDKHASDDGRNCPPGLAKKHNGCMPPGQAKKYAVGKRFPSDVRYYSVPQPVIATLPPAPVGHRYVRVGNDVLLLAPRSGMVVNIVLGKF